MSNSKTDKIRERLERVERSLESARKKLEFNRSRKVGLFVRNDAPKLYDALEAVVDECEHDGGPRIAGYDKIIDIIADELDVEEG